MFHVCSSKRGPLIYESINSSVLGVGSRGQLFVTCKADLPSRTDHTDELFDEPRALSSCGGSKFQRTSA